MKILGLFILFSSLSYSFLASHSEEPAYIEMSDRIIAKTSKEIIKKYPQMRLIGTGGAFMDCIHEVSLSFAYKGPLNKEESRQIVIDCAHKLLNDINLDNKIRPFLETAPNPFNIRNIEIILFISDENGKTFYDPLIAVASCVNGFLLFCTNSPELKTSYKNCYKESFEEALKIIQAEGT